MKRFMMLALTGLALSAVPATAQISLYGGGGAAFPGGDFDDVDSGLQLVGGITFDVSEMLSLYAEGQWGTHDADSEPGADVSAKPSALMAGLLVGLTGDEDAAVSPYLFGGIGLQNLEVEGSSGPVSVTVDDRTFAFQLGAGIGFDIGSLPAFLEGRYQAANYDDFGDLGDGEAEFSLFSILFGFSFDLGGDN